jgi:ABC-type lipoprotein export system ATPase subunit
MVLAEIRGNSNGAQFRRADLHIHSFGVLGSYDVTDPTMTPEGIVDTAIDEKLDVIAITDHNVVGNVRPAVIHAEGKAILVVPGVELSTQQGHLLVYCPTPEQLEGFYGKLTITADKKGCSNTIPQILKFAEEFRGFGICAHIESDAGLEKAHPKFDAFKQEIFNCKNLLGLEILHIDNISWFSHTDDNSDRRHCIVLRCQNLECEEELELAKVMSSDAHTLGALGKNAAGNRRLTRFKMESLSFDSLRVSLLDSAARVRLEDLIPPMIPHFVGMKLEGGFLKDQVVHFSRNLTCIIGGRGAGKSTMLESLRVSSGNVIENSVVDSDVWPDAITLVYSDEVGQLHYLSRSKSNEVINTTDENGPTRITIESYGQGETAQTIRQCGEDPGVLLEFLDSFLDLSQFAADEETVREELLNNQTEIDRLTLEVNQIAGIEKAKKIADQQVATLKAQKAGELVDLEQKLATERKFRENLKDQLDDLLKSIKDGLKSEELTNLFVDVDGTNLAVGKAEFDQVKSLVDQLANDIKSLSTQLNQKIGETATKVVEQLKQWTAKEHQTQSKIEQLRRELEKQNIKLDMAFIRKVTKDSIDHAAKLVKLRKSVPTRMATFKLRKQLIAKRRSRRSVLFTTRQAFATLMNKNLAATVIDYNVNIKFHEGVYQPALEELVKDSMGWRTSQVSKAKVIATKFSALDLFDIIEKNERARLEALLDENNNRVFSPADAAEIIQKLGTWDVKCEIVRCQFQDRPEIKVTKVFTDAAGKTITQAKDFANLSLGQQQSILLSILLFSKSKSPLIIDQPEDNLDSEFIYKTLVRALRGIKEHRQVIIVTHNANIAVLGDAELILPLRGASEYAVIRDRGSIDTADTKDLVCTILEGSPKAFKRRKEVYGY